MPSIVYERCKQIVELCKARQYYQEIPIEELKQIISENIGGDPRTLKLYLGRLQYFGFMKQLNPKVMQINPQEIDRKAVRKQQETIDKAILKQYGIRV